MDWTGSYCVQGYLGHSVPHPRILIHVAVNKRNMFAVAASQVALQNHRAMPSKQKNSTKLGAVYTIKSMSCGKCMVHNHGAQSSKEPQNHCKIWARCKINRFYFAVNFLVLKDIAFFEHNFPHIYIYILTIYMSRADVASNDIFEKVVPFDFVMRDAHQKA